MAAVLITLFAGGTAAFSAAVVAPAPRLTAAVPTRAVPFASVVHGRRPTVHALRRASTPSMMVPFVPVPILPAGLLPWPGLLPEALAVTTTLFTAFAASGQRMLTQAGLVNAWFLSVILWGTLGWQGFVTGVVYLFCGSAVTKLGMAKKESLGIAEARGGQRGPENVWGAAATAALCALGHAAAPQLYGAIPAVSALGLVRVRALLLIGYVASLATKLGDTFASEIGKAYGNTTYLATNFAKERTGPRRPAPFPLAPSCRRPTACASQGPYHLVTPPSSSSRPLLFPSPVVTPTRLHPPLLSPPPPICPPRFAPALKAPSPSRAPWLAWRARPSSAPSECPSA